MGRPAIGERAETRCLPVHEAELAACLADLAADWPAGREPPKRADALRLAIERSARLRVQDEAADHRSPSDYGPPLDE